MTAFLPLEAATPLPPSPAFLVPSPDPVSHMKRVIKAVLKARRIAVVCGESRRWSTFPRDADGLRAVVIGAGISVNAGIPDFRSSEGLFQSLKKDHPTLSSGKDLFDASVFNVSPRFVCGGGCRGGHVCGNLPWLDDELARHAPSRDTARK